MSGSSGIDQQLMVSRRYIGSLFGVEMCPGFSGKQPSSTGHVEDCICAFRIPPQFFSGGFRGDDEQFDVRRSASRFTSGITGSLP